MNDDDRDIDEAANNIVSPEFNVFSCSSAVKQITGGVGWISWASLCTGGLKLWQVIATGLVLKHEVSGFSDPSLLWCFAGTLKSPSELHQCYIKMDMRNSVAFGSKYDGYYENIRMYSINSRQNLCVFPQFTAYIWRKATIFITPIGMYVILIKLRRAFPTSNQMTKLIAATIRSWKLSFSELSLCDDRFRCIDYRGPLPKFGQ